MSQKRAKIYFEHFKLVCSIFDYRGYLVASWYKRNRPLIYKHMKKFEMYQTEDLIAIKKYYVNNPQIYQNYLGEF